MPSPRPALLIPARNKAAHVGDAIRSALAQTYKGLRIVISDQGSTDDTRQVIADAIKRYKGPHEVVVYDCPDRTAHGLGGLNAHIRWLHEKLDDITHFHVNAADDTSEPLRVERVMEAFRSTGASYVGTHYLFLDPTGVEEDMGTIFPKETSFIRAEGMFTQKVGGSCSAAWRRDLFEEFPTVDDVIPDLWLPYFATCRDGFFVIAERLATYIKHADPANAGLQGQLRAASTDIDKQVIEERIWSDISRTLARIFAKASHMDPARWPEASRQGVYLALIEHCLGWAKARHTLDEMKAEALKAAA